MLKEQLLLTMLKESTTPISNLLLANYQAIGLNDQEMMLFIHLLYYQSKGNFFPSVNELEKRMSISIEDIMRLLQRLVKQGFLFIEDTKEKGTGKISESYNLTPLYLKIIKELERSFEIQGIEKEQKESTSKTKNIFEIFEQEFGRPLSPLEIELINTWIDTDKYHQNIIILALKESVYANKLNFRYIDRILFDWQKRNLKTEKQVKEYIRKFRLNYDNKVDSESAKKKDFEFYNWLEND